MNTRINILFFIITNEFSNKQTIWIVQNSFDLLLASELSYKAFLSTLARFHQLSYVSRSLTHYIVPTVFYHLHTLFPLIHIQEHSTPLDHFVLKLPFREIRAFIPRTNTTSLCQLYFTLSANCFLHSLRNTSLSSSYSLLIGYPYQTVKNQCSKQHFLKGSKSFSRYIYQPKSPEY